MTSYDAWNNRGADLFSLGRYQEALDSFDRALALKPDKAMYWFNRGNALLQLDQLRNALASYNTVLLIDINYPQAEAKRNIVLKELEQRNKLKLPVVSSNKQLRPFGLCAGEFTVPDDFDAPLPEDILSAFEGK
jgi:tetratricopeptide (TPR) repeat protein